MNGDPQIVEIQNFNSYYPPCNKAYDDITKKSAPGHVHCDKFLNQAANYYSTDKLKITFSVLSKAEIFKNQKNQAELRNAEGDALFKKDYPY